jgi:hypothetical protein
MCYAARLFQYKKCLALFQQHSCASIKIRDLKSPFSSRPGRTLFKSKPLTGVLVLPSTLLEHVDRHFKGFGIICVVQLDFI